MGILLQSSISSELIDFKLTLSINKSIWIRNKWNPFVNWPHQSVGKRQLNLTGDSSRDICWIMCNSGFAVIRFQWKFAGMYSASPKNVTTSVPLLIRLFSVIYNCFWTANAIIFSLLIYSKYTCCQRGFLWGKIYSICSWNGFITINVMHNSVSFFDINDLISQEVMSLIHM